MLKQLNRNKKQGLINKINYKTNNKNNSKINI